MRATAFIVVLAIGAQTWTTAAGSSAKNVLPTRAASAHPALGDSAEQGRRKLTQAWKGMFDTEKDPSPVKQEGFGNAENVLNEAIVGVDTAVGEAKTEKYDKIGEVTGRYYCAPGYSTFVPPARRRLQQTQSSQCNPCGLNAYCPGGFQTLQRPDRVDCPLPQSGTGVTQFTTGTVTTGDSRDACIASCIPGTFAADPVYGPCDPCGYGYVCPGGFQGRTGFNTARIPCPPGTNTTTTEATSPTECAQL